MYTHVRIHENKVVDLSCKLTGTEFIFMQYSNEMQWDLSKRSDFEDSSHIKIKVW